MSWPASGSLAARVVLYNPDRDVAVLHVPGLRRPALQFTDPAGPAAAAVVAGYPRNGPLTAVPARIGGEIEVTGPNIYQDRRVTREVYTVRGRVLPGNSGGPLLSRSGRVYGVIFAASIEHRDVGYALTADEVAPDARRGATLTAAVSSGACN
jgi:S1-C subfamily serine protease